MFRVKLRATKILDDCSGFEVNVLINYISLTKTHQSHYFPVEYQLKFLQWYNDMIHFFNCMKFLEIADNLQAFHSIICLSNRKQMSKARASIWKMSIPGIWNMQKTHIWNIEFIFRKIIILQVKWYLSHPFDIR